MKLVLRVLAVVAVIGTSVLGFFVYKNKDEFFQKTN